MSDSFKNLLSLDTNSREKTIQRQIHAVKKFVEQSRQKNPHFSWSHCAWPVIFLPVITKFFTQLGKINAVNPGLAGMSGLMGMSKYEVNKRLNPDFRPRNIFCQKLPATKAALQKKFREKYQSDLVFPIIIKPDVGERSNGVQFILESNIDKYLSQPHPTNAVIIEEFIPYMREFGLSWLRDPDTHVYEIIALTERVTPRAIADGIHSLRECITGRCAELSIPADKQAIILAGFTEKELNTINFQDVVFVRTAGISYGTSLRQIPLNTELMTKLSALVSQFITDNTHLHAGRFDIKADSIDGLLAGKCTIIEINGVAGTPLEIYDNDISIDEKYEILFNYFGHVLMIADKNIKKNKGIHVSKITGIKALTRLFFGKKKTQALPESVWKNLREVFAILLKGRFEESSLGKFLEKIRN